ncbi:MAG: hypothetical protein KJZ86_26365, partial [Caldilineaceae bacterium]|nr:hypothetical protein [Caldilineaceae bacterium]
DPTGHCATTTNGEPDMNGDGECWQMANAIAGLGYTEQGFWDDWGGKNRSDWWLKNIANQSFATLEYLTPFYERYQGEFEGRTGLRQSVSLEPVPPHPVSGVADTIVPILLSDCETKDCVALTIDSIGVAGSSLTLASPVCGPFILECAGIGTAVGRGATIVGLGWTVVQGARDNASNADGLVAGFTAGVALTTKDPRIGLLAGVSQFLWDTFISPFDAWR